MSTSQTGEPVDLDLSLLEEELTAAGYFVMNNHGDLFVGINEYERYTKRYRVHRDGKVYADNAIDFACLDIIRRHLSPQATDDLREKIELVMQSFGLLDADVGGNTLSDVADSILAMLAEKRSEV